MKRIPIRYILVFIIFLLMVFLYIDRICISIAKNPIAHDLNLTDTQMGWILSMFSIGYALFQVPCGILTDQLGARLILTMVVILWSLFTGLTGLAASFIFLIIVRLLFGACEAGALPGVARALYSWAPLNERGTMQGINFAGSRLGAAFCLPFVAWLVATINWRNSFMLLMIIGTLWAIAWFLWFRDMPENHPSISPDELNYILKHRQLTTIEQKFSTVQLKRLFKLPMVWYLMAQYFCSNFTFFFCLTWLFPYLKKTYALSTLQAGVYTAAPLACGALGNVVSGRLVDIIYQRGHWALSRRLPAIIGSIFAVIGLLSSIHMQGSIISVVFLSIVIFGADMTLCPSWSSCIDIGGKNAGAVSGAMNMAGNIGSFITALAFPYLQSWTGSTGTFFLVGALLNILAIILWLFIDPQA